jgi:hypothetical protein
MKPGSFKKAMLVCMIIFCMALVGVNGVFSPDAIAKDIKEIGPNRVQGKVISIETHPFGRRGIIVVKSDQTGESYTFLVGVNTGYVPRRYPAVGETVKVSYIDDRGQLKASMVEIVESAR